MRQAVDSLAPENARAFALYRRVMTRFFVDTQGAGAAFVRLTAAEDDEAFGELADRCAVIHDVMCPVRKSDGA